MKKEWIGVIAAAVLVCAVVLPQEGLADYIVNAYMQAVLDNEANSDSMVVLANSPEPVEVSSNNTIFNAFNADSTSTDWWLTGPSSGVSVDGAKGILISMTWDELGTGALSVNKDDFVIYHQFSTAAFDSNLVSYPSMLGDGINATASDSILVDGSAVYGYRNPTTGALPTVTFYVPLHGERYVGYYYMRIRGQGLTVLDNMNATARVVF